jgi:hypothetical protein
LLVIAAAWGLLFTVAILLFRFLLGLIALSLRDYHFAGDFRVSLGGTGFGT